MSYIAMVKYALIVGILFSAGFGTAWKWQALNIAQLELEVQNDNYTRQKESFKQFELDSVQKSNAINSKVSRDASLRSDADRATDSSNGLRSESANTARYAQESATACFASIEIYDQLLSEVVEYGGRMAAEADAWESDAIMQFESAR